MVKRCAAEGIRMKRCGLCGKKKPAGEFGKVGTTEACGPCMPRLIEASAAAMRRFVRGFRRHMASKP